MRIMLDANVLVSAILIRHSKVADVVRHIKDNHKIVLCRYLIDEVIDTYYEKFPDMVDDMKNIIAELNYEPFDIDHIDPKKYPKIRDIKDLPILANAIEAKVDVLITGDKDFETVKIDKPRILKPREYQDEFMR